MGGGYDRDARRAQQRRDATRGGDATSGRDDDHREADAPEPLPELSLPEDLAPAGGATIAALLGERYQVVARLGTGAFGEVYRAHDRVLGRDVAIKRIRLEAFAEPGQLEEVERRFLREAQVAARLRHPAIVTTHDIVSSPRTSFIVMELVQGRTLEALLRERSRLSLEETTSILGQVAAALDHAHALQVVHRDVKPANIMVEPGGQVKVMDFGIAKLEAGGNLTASGLILGTPNYMSPEQARGGSVDARSDLFSVGCVLYECLTGVRPFQADHVSAILIRILTEEPPPVDLAATGLPPAIEAVLRRAMAKDPEARFGSGAELVEALHAVGSAPTRATRARRDAPTVVARPAADARRRRRLGLVLAGAAGGLFLAGLGWLALEPYARPAATSGRPGALVVEEPRGLVDRLLRRRPQLRITLPAGTPLRLAIEQPLSSQTAVAGSRIEAATTGPVVIEGVVALPPGTRVAGRVAHAASAERARGRGELTLVFEALELAGARTELRTRPISMRAPAPKRRTPPPRRGNAVLDGLAEVGDAVEGLFGRLKGAGASVEGGKAAIVTATSAFGREVTLPARAPLAVELAEPTTLRRPRP